jgi:hypothetical protein
VTPNTWKNVSTVWYIHGFIYHIYYNLRIQKWAAFIIKIKLFLLILWVQMKCYLNNRDWIQVSLNVLFSFQNINHKFDICLVVKFFFCLKFALVLKVKWNISKQSRRLVDLLRYSNAFYTLYMFLFSSWKESLFSVSFYPQFRV